MNIKELIDSKREYYEQERELGEEINQFIRNVVKEFNPVEYDKNYYIKIDFNEVGKYGDYELEITSVADYLSDEVIGALVREYNLLVTYKCSQTGFNLSSGEVNRDKKVFFRYADVEEEESPVEDEEVDVEDSDEEEVEDDEESDVEESAEEEE